MDYRFYEEGHNYAILGAMERIDLTEANDIYSLQHVGIHEGQEMKHWREDWRDVGLGHWEQRVFGPSGGLRYQCVGKMEFNSLRCASSGAPKPLRDTNRTDYDVLDRETTLQFTSKGWIQAERNYKRPKLGLPVSNEVGWIEYVRVEEKLCKVGE